MGVMCVSEKMSDKLDKVKNKVKMKECKYQMKILSD